MLTVKCELTVLEVNGKDAKKDDARRLVVTSYKTKGCGEGEYVTVHMPGGGSATVRADELSAAIRSAAVTETDDEFPF
jgi:hypothetical protein